MILNPQNKPSIIDGKMINQIRVKINARNQSFFGSNLNSKDDFLRQVGAWTFAFKKSFRVFCVTVKDTRKDINGTVHKRSIKMLNKGVTDEVNHKAIKPLRITLIIPLISRFTIR